MVDVVNRDISMTQGARYTDVIDIYQPLPNGLADETRPVNLTGWHATLTVKENADDASAVLILDDIMGGIVIAASAGRITITATPDQTATLPLIAGYYDLAVVPSLGVDYQEFIVSGRAVVYSAISR